MNSTELFRRRHTLDAVDPALTLKLGVSFRTGYFEHRFSITAQIRFRFRDKIERPTAERRITSIHRGQFRSEQSRFFPAGAGADFQDQTILVGQAGGLGAGARSACQNTLGLSVESFFLFSQYSCFFSGQTFHVPVSYRQMFEFRNPPSQAISLESEISGFRITPKGGPLHESLEPWI